MKNNIISSSIMLIAGIIVSIIGTVKHFQVDKFVITLLISLIIFFVIGKIFEAFLKNKLADAKKAPISQVETVVESENKESEV